jgi:hypothetical protein
MTILILSIILCLIAVQELRTWRKVNEIEEHSYKRSQGNLEVLYKILKDIHSTYDAIERIDDRLRILFYDLHFIKNQMDKKRICKYGYCGCPDCHVLADKWGNVPVPKISVYPTKHTKSEKKNAKLMGLWLQTFWDKNYKPKVSKTVNCPVHGENITKNCPDCRPYQVSKTVKSKKET